PLGWAALRRVRTLLNEIGPAMAEENDGEISEVMSLLGQLFPSPGPPDAFRGDPEEAEAPAHRIVGSLESGLGVSLFPDRDRVTLLTLVEDLIGSACEAYADGSVRVGRERIMLAHFFYDEYQREMLRLFDPELAARTAD